MSGVDVATMMRSISEGWQLAAASACLAAWAPRSLVFTPASTK